MVVPNYPSSSEALCDVSEPPCFYSVMLIASRQTPKLENHSWSAVQDCLFNIFTTNPHIWRPTPPSATQGTHHAMVTGTPLTLREKSRLRVFEYRILRRIFGPKRDENGEWRWLHSKELHICTIHLI